MNGMSIISHGFLGVCNNFSCWCVCN